MKRGRDDEPQERNVRRRLVSLEESLHTRDQKVFSKLKDIKEEPKLWTYFSRAQQDSLGGALGSVHRSTFEDLKSTYNEAYRESQKANKIARANKASVLSDYVPGQSQAGKLVVMFMNIGSGDCIFIKTPKGKTIVVDCGQRSSLQNREDYVQEIQDMLKSPLFLDGAPQLYALILTHPDKDHYNEVTKIIKPCVNSVMHAFYSLNKGEYSAGFTYKYLDEAEILNKVTINSSVVDIQTSEKGGWEKLYYKIATKRMIQILGHDEERANWDEDTCNIYLLAAGVPPNRKGTKRNAGSIVTLIEVHNRFDETDANKFSRKVLLTGDATTSTEDFLLTEHQDLIGDVDLIQLEHHGSGTDHAGDEFVKKVNPVLAAASSGPHLSDLNPRWTTIQAYVGQSRICKGMDEHKIKYAEDRRWTDMHTNAWYNSELKTYGLFATESNHDLCFIIDGDGNLIREFYKKLPDAIHKYTYTISHDGTVTPSSQLIEK